MKMVIEKEIINFVFENGIVGNAIPPEFINAVEKGFNDAMVKGSLMDIHCKYVENC
jgi:translation elongation factor EF-G